MKISPNQRRCLIEATIDLLVPFPRGFARSKQGPFFELRTIRPLVARGYLRIIKEVGGRRRMFISARAT
jgi:hypothetical protein